MKLLVDMNLSPEWVSFLETEGIEAVHWSTVGDPRAKDSEILRYAREAWLIVFTHDLDFSQLLAHTRGKGPSVIQLRAQDVTPQKLCGKVVAAVGQFESEIAAGCILTVDEHSSRVRILPIR